MNRLPNGIGDGFVRELDALVDRCAAEVHSYHLRNSQDGRKRVIRDALRRAMEFGADLSSEDIEKVRRGLGQSLLLHGLPIPREVADKLLSAETMESRLWAAEQKLAAAESRADRLAGLLGEAVSLLGGAAGYFATQESQGPKFLRELHRKNKDGLREFIARAESAIAPDALSVIADVARELPVDDELDAELGAAMNKTRGEVRPISAESGIGEGSER